MRELIRENIATARFPIQTFESSKHLAREKLLNPNEELEILKFENTNNEALEFLENDNLYHGA